MKTNFKVENPKDIELTMTVTMTLDQWNELASQLSEKWPSWDFSSRIIKMIREATKHFTSDDIEVK